MTIQCTRFKMVLEKYIKTSFDRKKYQLYLSSLNTLYYNIVYND